MTSRQHKNIKIQRTASAYKMALKEALVIRDGWFCGVCCQTIWELKSATIDHKKALGLGGGTVFDNLQLAHAECNARKNHTEQVQMEQWKWVLLS